MSEPSSPLQSFFRDKANRHCADCNVHLTHVTNTFASFLPLNFYIDERWTRRNWIKTKYGRNFVQMHESFAPKGHTPSTKCVKTTTKALAEFIASCRNDRVSLTSVAHGVFICKTCAEIHSRLGSSITKVKLISDSSCWSEGEYKEMSQRGNTHGNHLLEKFMPREWITKKRNCFEIKLEREVFIRKKYEILDFILPVHRQNEPGNKKLYTRKKTATKKWKKLAVQTERDIDWAIYTLAYKCYKDRKDTKKLNSTQIPLEITQDIMKQMQIPVQDVVKKLKIPKANKLEVPLEASHNAVHFLQDARRKKIGLISYVVRIQSYVRMLQVKQRLFPNANTLNLREVLKKTIKIQTRTRSYLLNKRYTKKKELTIKCQAYVRGFQHRILYSMTRGLIIKIQAIVRGYFTRRNVGEVMNSRSATYREQIVQLWSKTSTPLAYRTKFWLHINSPGFTSFASQEYELLRLWKILGFDMKRLKTTSMKQKSILTNIVYAKVLHVEARLNSPSHYDNDIPVSSRNFEDYAKRVQLERVQIYERLSRNKDSLNQTIYKFADVKKGDKAKKVRLSKAIWGVPGDNALKPEVSTSIFDLLFPEIRQCSDINPLMPSKKGLQRLSVQENKSGELLIPRPIEEGTMHLKSNLDNRTIKNLAEISRSFVTGVKHLELVGTLSNDFESMIMNKNHHFNHDRYLLVHKYVHGL